MTARPAPGRKAGTLRPNCGLGKFPDGKPALTSTIGERVRTARVERADVVAYLETYTVYQWVSDAIADGRHVGAAARAKGGK